MRRACLFVLLLGGVSACSQPVQPAVSDGAQEVNEKSTSTFDAAEQSWRPLFKDDDLSGWEGRMQYWTLKDGDLVGSNLPDGLDFSTFLCSKKRYRDFELKFQVRLKGSNTGRKSPNGGVNFRSEILEKGISSHGVHLNRSHFQLRGPQADLGGDYWGAISREFITDHPGTVIKKYPRAVASVQADAFNDYYVKCVGEHVTVKVNGRTTVDDDLHWMAEEGILGWQLHANPTEVTYRNILIRELPPDMRRRERPAEEAPKPAGEGYVIRWDFDSRKATPNAQGEILVPVPSDEPYQKVRWTVSGVKSHRVLKAEGGKLLAVRPRRAVFSVRITVWPTATEIRKPCGKVPIPASASACLRDKAVFAARNPKIAKLARDLKGDSPVETVANIRRWIKDHMHYQWDEELKAKEQATVGGIDSILTARHGDCGDHAILFASLCCQAGVPARVIWGVVRIPGKAAIPEGFLKLAKTREVGELSGHGWAEVYIKDWGWIPLEPQGYATDISLGTVMKGFVPFTRLRAGYIGMGRDTALALMNVIRMNYFPRLEPLHNSDSTKEK